MIKRGSDEAIPEAEDRQDIEAQFQIAMKVLEWTETENHIADMN